VAGTSAQLDRCWMDHYSAIYSHPAHVSSSALSNLQQLPVLQKPDSPFTIEDVKLAIRGLMNKKIPGQDGIHAEILKSGGKPLLTALFRIFLNCWNRRCLPDDFTSMLASLLYIRTRAIVGIATTVVASRY